MKCLKPNTSKWREWIIPQSSCSDLCVSVVDGCRGTSFCRGSMGGTRINVSLLPSLHPLREGLLFLNAEFAIGSWACMPHLLLHFLVFGICLLTEGFCPCLQLDKGESAPSSSLTTLIRGVGVGLKYGEFIQFWGSVTGKLWLLHYFCHIHHKGNIFISDLLYPSAYSNYRN